MLLFLSRVKREIWKSVVDDMPINNIVKVYVWGFSHIKSFYQLFLSMLLIVQLN